jgi:S-formylglutathione hydrolase
MKRIILILTILFLGLLTAIAQNQGKVVIDTVHSPSLEGNLLGDSPDREVYIYLPAEYEDYPDKRYPVVYLLSAFPSSASRWFDGSHCDIKQIMDQLVDQEIVNPMILVSPDNENKYLCSQFANSSVTGNWENFNAVDLVQYVDSHYRTLPQTASRGIAGYCMGGYGAIKLAMKHPDVFGSLFGLSSPGIIDMETQINKTNFKNSIMTAIESG